MPSPYAHEVRIAQLAVQRAVLLTRRVFAQEAKATLDKADRSPVTIGDFGAQVLIAAALRHNFPNDGVVAEEEGHELQRQAQLADKVWEAVRATHLTQHDDELGAVASRDDMLALLDHGRLRDAAPRVWTIDPIDGTKGFLRGGQYAVCLALLDCRDVKVAVLACPNLPVDNAVRLSDMTPAHPNGVLFSALKGHGAWSRPLTTGPLAPPTPIAMRHLSSLDAATFCESVEPAHSSHSHQAAIAHALAIQAPSVRMDSQAKYASIARGAADIYLRLPVSATYQEKIWDHAAGDLIVREAGGTVTDVHGKPLDFTAGHTLANNKGVVAAPAALHPAVLHAVQQVLHPTHKP
ncbi:hypothetical protein CDD82_1357 [Ophiocordyceps australis]|uniref:3'(2'),5'-bisphosphate nucleotidase n=1 Tax=Ophiocordyceps australis TaxID=1399860 RepID=A0A2C5ZP21_9HYPO|nr:hypothetical protein CDD82_1357 [Ophiocordyceps australis]